MINPIIVLNSPNKRALNQALDPVRRLEYFELQSCKSVASLYELPAGEEYHRFIIGPSGVVTPEDLATWLALHVSMRAPSTGIVFFFVGDVPNQEEYAQVIRGHFGMWQEMPKVVIINDPEEHIIDTAIPQYGNVQLIPCPSLDELMALPEGFYEHIMIGAAQIITPGELAYWMDAKIPTHRHYQVNIILAGPDLDFLNVHRRYLPE
jgi:hypothetical protein